MAAGVASSTRYYTLPYCYVRLHKAAVDQSTVYVDTVLYPGFAASRRTGFPAGPPDRKKRDWIEEKVLLRN